MSAKQKKTLYRIIAAFLIYVVVILVEKMAGLPILENRWALLVLYLVPYAVIGWDIVYKAVRNIFNGQVFDENFLMFVATVGAFIVGEDMEAVAVMLFYQVGEFFQSYAVSKSRKSISDLMDICPEYANIEVDGKLTQVDPDDVELGSIIIVKAGERIPLDGVVVDGDSMIDTSSLTGESVPRHVTKDSDVISGCVNGSGVLSVRTTKEFDDSTVAKILELVENASSKKAPVENFITKFARYYTPVVVIGALLLAILPPLFFGAGWMDCLLRACTFLVISCPCALVISVPLSFFSGIGAASKAGILVKGSNYLEAVANMDTIVFDKTGTLTKGEFSVTEICPVKGYTKEALLEYAAYAESYSNHPIAVSIRGAFEGQGKCIDVEKVSDSEELSGHGLKVVYEGKTIMAGNDKLMASNGISFEKCSHAGTIVYLAVEHAYAGYIVISDVIKPEAKAAIAALKKIGVGQTIMLTGDSKEAGEAVAKELGLDQVFTQLLPADKVKKVEELMSGKLSKSKVAFVGDGINDAPVLTRADIGFAMGSMGSDAAIEAADIVLMDDNTEKIAKTVAISRKTLRIVKQNIVFALGVKLFILILGALGIASMWAAVFADVGVSVIAILNSMRMLRFQ